MRKILLFAFAAFSVTAIAQETEVPVKKHSVSTNSFWSNWFVSLGADFNAHYSSQEQNVSLNPFSDKRATIGFDVAVGKWFTPGIGLRTKFHGLRGKTVNSERNHPLYNGMNVHEDVLFNLTNMLCGYKPERLYNLIPYVGLGVADNFDEGDPSFTYNVGILNNFNVGKRVALFVDIFAYGANGGLDGIGPNDARLWKRRHSDSVWGVSAGITYNLNKRTWSKTPDVDALMALNRIQVEDLRASLDEQREENERLRELASQTPVAPVTNVAERVETKIEYVSVPLNVFFNIGSSVIASRKDLVAVQNLVDCAKTHGKTILVTGYADSKTGSVAYNQKLSRKRAEVVAEELVTMGIDRNNIEIVAAGGVELLKPDSYNRRVTIELK